MKKYRIREHITGNSVEYEVQRKVLNLFWCTDGNSDSYYTGFFDELEDAKRYVEQKLIRSNIKVVKTYNV